MKETLTEETIGFGGNSGEFFLEVLKSEFKFQYCDCSVRILYFFLLQSWKLYL